MGIKRREDSGAMNLSIIAGSLMQKVSEDHPDAVAREYEDKDDNKKTKWEIPYSSIDGVITSIEFKDGDFGEQVIITLTDVDEVYKVYMPTDSRYFTDLAKKLPNVDLTREVELFPYDFEGDNGKPVKGMSVKQEGEKVYSYYYDADKKETINGLPQPDDDWKTSYDKDDWKMFFIKERKFLKKAVQSVDFSSVVSKPRAKVSTSVPEEFEVDEGDDLPF